MSNTNMQSDVVIVAAGLSGLAASIAAAEEGKSVITVEKSNVTGGAANMGMSPLGIGTKYQRAANFNMTPGEAFRKHMNFIHWQCLQSRVPSPSPLWRWLLLFYLLS